MDIRPGTVLDGPDGTSLIIESLIGRGGFGQVLAGRLSNGTRVAIKTVLTATLDDDELRTLQNEAMIATTIDHQNVVRVLHVNDGKDDTDLPPYMVMEFIEGGNLRDLISRHRTDGTMPTVEDLRTIYLQIAEGMKAINTKVVHRDLKPENVLIDAKSNLLKIADFGLAKLADAATRSDTFKGWGSLPYQPPEAFDFGPNTVAMDMYAAGIMFYELATLTWPIQPKLGENTSHAWRNAHLLSAPSDLRSSRTDIPQHLVQTIMLMLNKDPKRRPQSWDEIIESLKKDSAPASGSPDVRILLHKATATLRHRTEADAKARQEMERETERRSLLEQAFLEPVEVLQTLVTTFNAATEVGKLTLRKKGQLLVEVGQDHWQPQLIMSAEVLHDLDTKFEGICRMICMVSLDPPLFARTVDEEHYNPFSFDGFNLVYRVSEKSEKFGKWSQFRFEIHPLINRVSNPRWFALKVVEFERQLQMLRTMGKYQFQQRPLDDEWFKLLLEHVL